ncbi:MAG: hypothetical protein ACI87W_002778 [Halieaceae bacterium]|jgi:hypothetical protein
MKSKKLLKRLADYLSADERTQKKETKAIKKVLKALKEREKTLKLKLAAAEDEERAAAIQSKLDVIYAQRSKGIERVRKQRESGK